MTNKIPTILFFTLCSVSLFAQSQFDKADISKNWMLWSIESPQTKGQEMTRTELGKSPKADFIIKADGTYDIRFENIGKGTWRLEDGYLVLWGTDPETINARIELLAKITSLQEESMTLQFITQTKHYDWKVKLVPFN